MQPVSDQFLAALRYSHVISASCDLYFPDDLATPVPVPVEAGTVTIDRTAQNRRAGTVTIPWSLRAGEDLGLDLRTLTLGGYCVLRRGLRYATGASELVRLGTFRVESVTWNTTDASAGLEVADRMSQVRDEPFTAPLNAKGLTPASAAVRIVRDVFGTSINYLTPYTPAATLGDVVYTGDRVTDALSLLEQDYGAETYFDAAGDFVFAQKPADDAPVLWTVDAGELGVMIGASESLDRTGIYNGVLVQGQAEADAPPVSALATYNEPTSPIRWGGPFGKVALIADSSTVTTVAQAAAAAQDLLRLRLKHTRSLELTNAPNPALEAGDTIGVRFPDGRDETHLIDAVIVDLAGQAQQIITRTQATPTSAPAVEADQLFYGRSAWQEAAAAALVSA